MNKSNQTVLWDKNNGADKGIPGFIALFEKYYGDTIEEKEARMRAGKLIRLVKIVYNL